MIITIDGPAGTGKSSVSQQVARLLGYDFLDTGAMYRAVGLAAVRAGVSLDDAPAVEKIAQSITVDFDWTAAPPRVRLNGVDVAELIRTEAISHAASKVAVYEGVRSAMVLLQREVGRQRPNLVTEGRDQGTIVFPDAGLKIYLDASPEERAKRRLLQLRQKGENVDYAELLRQIIQRDSRDAGRAVGPLAKAGDAVRIDTTHLTLDGVIEAIIKLIAEREKRDVNRQTQ